MPYAVKKCKQGFGICFDEMTALLCPRYSMKL